MSDESKTREAIDRVAARMREHNQKQGTDRPLEYYRREVAEAREKGDRHRDNRNR